jgi:L-threonylcarbamoyladenylate synthase
MARILTVDPLKPDFDAVCTVAHEILHGRVIVYPTDTLYGIGADACNPEAIEKVFDIKKRGPQKPILILVNSLEMAKQVVEEIPTCASPLIEHFWPGPLTLIFRASPRLHSKLTGGTGTIGIRYPKHPFCLDVLRVCNRPITSTSANFSGEEQPQAVADIVAIFESLVDLIVDGGEAARHQPSTVVDVTGPRPRVLREGAITSISLQPYLVES